MHKPTICLDFDGVIHSYTSGWKGPRTIPDDPIPGAFGYMLHMLHDGFDVTVHSSRSGAWGGRRAMRRWMRSHAGACWYETPYGPGLEDVRFVKNKPPALLTIDDRALTFCGDWENPAYKPEAVRAFKPWNKRDRSGTAEALPVELVQALTGGYPRILNGDHAEFEAEWAGKDPKTRPDWPLPSFDAQDWAQAFCKVANREGLKDSQGRPVDEGWMISWFANALMRGLDEGLMRKPVNTFQVRVQTWMLACFGETISGDCAERNHRFLEEALELVQACGCSANEAHTLVNYVFGREVGEKGQEVGGVEVTLAALCSAQGIDKDAEAEIELARIWTKVDQIRAKQAAKPKHSPLP